MAESKWYCDACGARIDKRDVAAIRADAEAKLAALRSALFDEYGINVVDEALSVAIASSSEMEVNRERWQAARVALRDALAATPAEESGHVHDPFLADRCGGCAALAKPPSADVDAAREALLVQLRHETPDTLAYVERFEAAIRAEAHLARHKWGADQYRHGRNRGRAEGLDVERLARAVADHCHEGKHEGAPIFLRHKHLAPFLVDTCGAAVAAEYARLAKDAERPERTWQEDIEEFTR